MMERPYDDIRENLKRIEDTMAEAALASGRRPEEVRLLGVTKTVPPDRIQRRALEAGVRGIGKNRVREFLGKGKRFVWMGWTYTSSVICKRIKSRKS